VKLATLIDAAHARHFRFYAAGGRPWGDTDWVVAIGGEVGEALNIVKKLTRDSQGMLGNGVDRDALLAALGSELADIVIYAAVVTGLRRRQLPWADFHGLRRYVRSIRVMAISSSLPALACELLWWAGTMAVTDGTREILTWRQIEGLIGAAADLADVAGIDLGAAVLAKFNATSEKLGFPERL
jgi:NTP pyrophosphatase (non-canonical NTP hydrolase)